MPKYRLRSKYGRDSYVGPMNSRKWKRLTVKHSRRQNRSR